MPLEMRQALTERRDLIEVRAIALPDTALSDGALWTTALGAEPKNAKRAVARRRHAVVVATYRDRYAITELGPLGAPPDNEAQRTDSARARASLDRARDLTRAQHDEPERTRQSGTQRARPSV